MRQLLCRAEHLRVVCPRTQPCTSDNSPSGRGHVSRRLLGLSLRMCMDDSTHGRVGRLTHGEWASLHRIPQMRFVTFPKCRVALSIGGEWSILAKEDRTGV